MCKIAPKPLIILDHDKIFADDFKTRLQSEGIDDVELSDYLTWAENQKSKKGINHILIIDYLSLKGLPDNELLLSSILKEIRTYVFILFPADTQNFSEFVPEGMQNAMGLIKDENNALMISSFLKKGFAAYTMRVQKNWFLGAIGVFIFLTIAALILILS